MFGDPISGWPERGMWEKCTLELLSGVSQILGWDLWNSVSTTTASQYLYPTPEVLHLVSEWVGLGFGSKISKCLKLSYLRFADITIFHQILKNSNISSNTFSSSSALSPPSGTLITCTLDCLILSHRLLRPYSFSFNLFFPLCLDNIHWLFYRFTDNFMCCVHCA